MSPLRICMVSDFFHPGTGGVESHIYQLAQCLLQRGHRVVVVTHFRGQRHGVRYMPNGLKVYYLPFLPFTDQVTLPQFYVFFPLLRKVLLREQIDIVHGHQATSNLAHECLFHAKTMGLKTVYTDHSLFGFGDAASIHLNKLLKFFLTNVDHEICVSYAVKENLVARAAVHPECVSVIPNAVDTGRFSPEPSRRPDPPTLTIVVMNRLTFRKGTDLLVDVVPEICRRHAQVKWIIGGDGPKRALLKDMLEREGLHDRVELLGGVPHHRVRDVLVRGHIFLNTSLTEAFCIAIVEAVACGLRVVSTDVGGVSEVLPAHMIKLAPPRAEAIVESLSEVLTSRAPDAEEAFRFHREVCQMYSWHDVACRTEHIYERLAAAPREALGTRLLGFLRVGRVSGYICLLVAALDTLLWWLLEWLQPASSIESAAELPCFPSSPADAKLPDAPLMAADPANLENSAADLDAGVPG